MIAPRTRWFRLELYSRTTTQLLLVRSKFFSTTYWICTYTKYIFFWKLANRGIQNTNKNKRSMMSIKSYLLGRNRKCKIWSLSPIGWADNFWSTHRTFIFLPVLDSSIGQISEKYILQICTGSISCRKKLETIKKYYSLLKHSFFKYNYRSSVSP